MSIFSGFMIRCFRGADRTALRLSDVGSNLKNIFLLLFCMSLWMPSGQAQSPKKDLLVYPYWSYYSDVSNVLYETICDTAFAMLAARNEKVKGLNTAAQWRDRQTEIRSALQELTGPFPEKTPLNAVVTDTIYRDGMRIEKLYFESRPGFYVSAIFCRPETVSGKIPAILFCSGHSDLGFRSDVYQHMIFNYVKKGFAVLAFDPIGQGERIRYLDEDGKPRMGPTKEHSYPGSQAFLAGLSPAAIFIADGIRAVDYLTEREEVDPGRIGITGRSGGGTQSAYIAAVDDRISAAAPECYITTYEKLLKSGGPQDAEQNFIGGISGGIDITDYIVARAPKPTLIVSTTRDIFSIQGTRDVFAEAKSAFSALGNPDNIAMTEDDAGHASTKKNREATYAFFRKHLRLDGSTEDEEVFIFDPEDLWVTPSGNVYRDLGGEDIFSLSVKYLSDHRQPEADRSRLQERVAEAIGYCAGDFESEAVFSGRTRYEAGYSIEKYMLKTRGGYYLPVVWMKPDEGFQKTVLYLCDDGKSAAAEKNDWADRWLEEGYSVVLADLSGMGEIGGGYAGGDARIDGVALNVWYAGLLTGRLPAGIHAGEINLLRSFISGESEERNEVILVSEGTVAGEVAHAVFLQPGGEKVVQVRALDSFHSLLADREYSVGFLMAAAPGGIQFYDYPDLWQGMAAEKLLFVDSVAGDGRLTDSSGNVGRDFRSDREIYDLISNFIK